MKDTTEQLLAQNTERNLAVTANAGSGKTHVLVERYLALLLGDDEAGHVPPRSRAVGIVAITFTRKAASEMLVKVTNRVAEMIQVETSQLRLIYLTAIRESLTYSKISTIHSFCSNILRSYPVEAGIPANFIELPGVELRTMLRSAIYRTLEDWLESDDARKNDLKRLYLYFDRKGLEENLARIIGKRGLLAQMIDYYERGFVLAAADRDEYLRGLVLPTLRDKLTLILDSIQFIDTNELKTKDAAGLQQAKAELEDVCGIIGLPDDIPFESIAELMMRARAARQTLFTTGGTLRKTMAKGCAGSTVAAMQSAEAALAGYDDLADSFSFSAGDEEMFDIGKLLCGLAVDVKAAFDEEKLDGSGIDFDDMIALTLKVLDDASICSKIRSGIRYLLIDEFQDTDSLQYEIVRRLVPELGSETLETDGITSSAVNLFIVGDAKQSIYGFRNADVRVFERARREICALNKALIASRLLSESYITKQGAIVPATEAETQGDLKLSVTFRLLPAVAGFVNAVCSRLMDKRESEFDVEYNQLVCARRTPENYQGSVSFLLFDPSTATADVPKAIAGEDEGETIGGLTGESRLLARFLARVTSPDSDCLVYGKDGTPRRPRWGDIAVLSTKKAALGPLIQELLSSSIPYVSYSGGGLFHNQEVLDLASYLGFIVNQSNDVACVASLRSPYFSLDDTELFEISRSGGYESFWQKLNSYCQAHHPGQWQYYFGDGNDDPAAELKPMTGGGDANANIPSRPLRACVLMHRAIKMAPLQPISMLIMKILDECAWWGIGLEDPANRSIQKNIDKIIQWARDFEARGFRSLPDFVDQLNQILDSDIDEPAPPPEITTNAVSLMTIHAAKGLEFPVVVLFNTNTRSARGGNFVLGERFAMAFETRAQLEGRYKSNVQTPMLKISWLLQRAADHAEEKRLLYVAMTRAKDHLVISGSLVRSSLGNINKPQGLMRLLGDAIDCGAADTWQAESFALALNQGYLIDDSIVYKDMTIDVKIIREAGPALAATDDRPVERRPQELLLTAQSRDYDNEMISATRLTTFMAGEREYVAKYVLGLPLDKKYEGPYAGTSASDNVLGTLAGSIIHRVLQEIRSWIASGKNLGERVAACAEGIIASMEKPIPQATRNRIITECMGIAQTPLLKEYSSQLMTARFEHELFLPVGGDFVMGKIDLLLRDREGNYEVWDWKTNHTTPAAMATIAGKYRGQMQLYSYLVSLLSPAQPAVRSRILFTRLAAKNIPDEAWSLTFEWTRPELLEFGAGLADVCHRMKQIS